MVLIIFASHRRFAPLDRQYHVSTPCRIPWRTRYDGAMTGIRIRGDNPLDRLRDALGEFLTAWRRKHAPNATRDARQLSGLATLVLLGAIVVTAWKLDIDGMTWAKELSPPVVHVFEKITKIGESGYIFALTALIGLIAIMLRHRGAGARVDAGLTQLAARAMFLFDVAAVSGIASQVLKHLFGRARPKLYDVVGAYHFDVFSIYASYASFPSGHTVTAFAMASAIAFLSPRVGYPLFMVAILVGISRVAIGSHYLSDVLAGAALGVGSALILRREFAARRIVFTRTDGGTIPRGSGLIWPALRRTISPPRR
jgi:membrane-associated phospholipid phosphatase